MASQMVIPASNDTLFIRGFSSRHHIDEIRDFFAHEGGRNTVEFFKETQSGDGLFIALKFESRSVAKDIINRFDNYEVLGDRIGISWYKDVRKARAYDNMNYHRGPMQRWPQDRFDYRQGGGGGYGRGRGHPMYRGGGGGNQRSGWYPRGGGDYGDRSRRYTRSSSRSHSRSLSPRSRSRSFTRSSDERGSRSRSDDSREPTRKRRRSASDGSNRRRSSRKGKGRASSSSQSPEPDQDSRSDSESLPPPTEPVSGKKGKGRGRGAKKSSASGSAERHTPSAARDSKTKDLDSSQVEGDVESSDVNEFAGEDAVTSSPPPQPVPPPTKSGGRSAVRSAVSSVAGKKAAVGVATTGAKAADDDTSDVVGVDAGSNAVTRKTTVAATTAAAGGDSAKLKKLKGRVMEDPISDEDDMFAEKSVPRRPTKESDEFPLERNKKSTKDTAPASDSDPASPSEMIADEPTAPVSSKRKPGAGGKKQPPATKEFDPFEEDMDESAGDMTTANKRRRHDGSGRGGRAAAAASNKRGPAPGAVGLSFEKMQLVRQKKEEIEKSYRQDCETFATVTKMLISKEPSLEDKIQNSLRENLKEIGHRCIQEMRDFIDRLKEEDIDDV